MLWCALSLSTRATDMSDYTESRIDLQAVPASVNTAWTTFDFGVPANVKKFHIEFMDLQITNISGASVHNFDWYLSVDADGEHAITPVKTLQEWSDGKGAAKHYSAAISRSRSSGSRGVGLYLHIKLDHGSATIAPFVEGARI